MLPIMTSTMSPTDSLCSEVPRPVDNVEPCGASLLVLSTSPTVTPMIRALLNAGALVRLVGSTDEARRDVGDVPPSLVVLADTDGGPRTLQRCAVLADHFGVPIIVWCDALSAAERAAASLLGQCDVAPRGLGPEDLSAEVLTRLRTSTEAIEIDNSTNRLAVPSLALLSTVDKELTELTFDDGRGHVLVNGNAVALTKTEREITRALLSRREEVWPREELIATVWGPKWFGAANLLDTHIRNLRTKLHAAGAHTRIATVWGVGYALEDRKFAKVG